ncbi:hypothetical protein SLE2022_046930 [Rubroshorea leprosula]
MINSKEACYSNQLCVAAPPPLPLVQVYKSSQMLSVIPKTRASYINFPGYYTIQQTSMSSKTGIRVKGTSFIFRRYHPVYQISAGIISWSYLSPSSTST